MPMNNILEENEQLTIIECHKTMVGSNIIDTFLQDFEITNNPEHFATSNSIESWLKANRMNVSMMKFGMEMKKHTKLQQMNDVINKPKKISGKSVQCWFGIRERTEINDDANA
jgi:hypothetical protein